MWGWKRPGRRFVRRADEQESCACDFGEWGRVYALILGSCEVPSVRERLEDRTALHKIGDMGYGGTRCSMINITTLWQKKS